MNSEIEEASLRTIKEMEYCNMVYIAMEILKCAYARKKSIGAHYRTDEGSGSND
jgi:aspartate oxidase